MEDSILKSTKKILSISAADTSFDLDVLTHINASFSTLTQLGIGPAEGIAIEDEEPKWSDLSLPLIQLNMVKTYIYLSVRQLFDPPATSFHIEAMNQQMAKLEWRLNVDREDALNGGSA